jgi:hypothetical protein
MSEERMIKTGFAIVNPKGELLVTTLRRRRAVAIFAFLKEGESWAMYKRWGYSIVQVTANGLISAN